MDDLGANSSPDDIALDNKNVVLNFGIQETEEQSVGSPLDHPGSAAAQP